jgi:CBS domain-containing protein
MLDLDMKAADIMTRDVVTVPPHASIRYVAKVMAERHVSGLPVVEESGRLVGMVTEGDLISWRGGSGEGEAWWLDMLAEGFEIAPDYLDAVQGEREKVRNVMKTDLVTATESTPLIAVARLMTERKVKRLPVLRDGKLVGIVARADLVRAFARG